MRSISLLGTILLAAATAAPLPAQERSGSAGIAYVNSQAALQQAPGADSAQKVFQQELEKYRQQAKQLTAELDSLQQQFDQQSGMLSEQARQQRQQELLRREKEVQTQVSKIEKKLQQRRQELMQPILKRVRGVIEEIRAERGYAMVFDVSGPSIVAADPALNITDEVIARLEERAASDGAGGADSAGSGGG